MVFPFETCDAILPDAPDARRTLSEGRGVMPDPTALLGIHQGVGMGVLSTTRCSTWSSRRSSAARIAVSAGTTLVASRSIARSSRYQRNARADAPVEA